MTKISKRITLTFFIVVISMLAIGLCACNGFGSLNPADIEKAKTTAYFGEVNTVAKEFNSVLTDFQTDVKDKNIEAMQNKLNESQSLIDQFNKIEVPENCSEIQKNYLDAFIQLQQALSDYVNIYSDFVNGQIDNSVLNERVANVQKSYNQGIELLNKADKLAAQF